MYKNPWLEDLWIFHTPSNPSISISLFLSFCQEFETTPDCELGSERLRWLPRRWRRRRSRARAANLRRALLRENLSFLFRRHRATDFFIFILFYPRRERQTTTRRRSRGRSDLNYIGNDCVNCIARIRFNWQRFVFCTAPKLFNDSLITTIIMIN